MNQELLQILVLAFVAGVVLVRLYTTLGKRTGAERSEQPAPAQGEFPRGPMEAPVAPAFAGGSVGEGVAAIERADPNFDAGAFLQGARGAYDLIVGAFAKGDRDALRGLLTPRVYDSYVAAIEAREAANGIGPEIVRLRTAEIAEASLTADTARVVVKFEAELAEGATGVRDARERWTFERNVRSSDPNWLLSRVQAA
ncbi:MAG: Tim44 domain-containing protein [Caulobacteraceae bacterium]|mgnify:CR=1 FL=1|nr:Tim44 domain-containing protein [Caulobacteraceae bacterium]MBP6689234.1 Tim44 domain-containing protein [Hyphomonadaceae bacterium]